MNRLGENIDMGKVRVGLIGAGKRVANIYAPLLKKLETFGLVEIVGYTTRTHATATKFNESMQFQNIDIKQFKTRDELASAGVDVFLICVNSNASADVIKSTLKFGIDIITETPVTDFSVLNAINESGVNVGVFEQWPYLPLEQFKQLLYTENVIERPFLVQNDCRSYDYHAFAQLRSYVGRNHRPASAYCKSISTKLVDYTNIDGSNGAKSDSWDIATVEMTNGAVLVHNFSYACKVAPFRSIQTLRAYSSNGTVVTGKIDDRSNDYEILDVNYVSELKSRKLVVNYHRSLDCTISIATSDNRIKWTNPFSDIGLNDMETAIATHFLKMHEKGSERFLYSIHDAAIDQLIVNAIKQSSMTNNVVRFK